MPKSIMFLILLVLLMAVIMPILAMKKGYYDIDKTLAQAVVDESIIQHIVTPEGLKCVIYTVNSEKIMSCDWKLFNESQN